MKDLITLTITYDDNKREAMVLSKNSEAHRAMLSYAEANGYATEQESANEIDHSKNHYLCDFRCADIVEIHTKESLEATTQRAFTTHYSLDGVIVRIQG